MSTKTLKQYMEEICSTDFTGVEQSLFGKVQERPIPKIENNNKKNKPKKKIKRYGKNRTKRTTN